MYRLAMRFSRVLLGCVVALVAAACCTPSADVRAAEARIAELERENASLEAELTRLRAVLRVVSSNCGPEVALHSCPPSQPAISASVLSVNAELRFVVLDKGARDDVKPGYCFEVYRGQKYKGQVRVQDVQETMCSAVIVHTRAPIAAGDAATTRL